MNWEVSKDIETLIPYVPGKPIEETKREMGLSHVVKLASNENALGPSPKVLEALKNALPEIHRYPDASGYQLTKKLSEKLQVRPESIVLGNGSNELIDLLIRVFCRPGEQILVAEKSFIAYSICAQAASVKVKSFPLEPGFKIPMRAILEDIKKGHKKEDKILFLPNPNNPTGTYFNSDELVALLEATQGRDNFMIVLDEAYNEFVRAKDYPDSLELSRKYPQLVILRTMAKVYGLAGLRLGYLVADPKICGYLHRVRNPFNVNSLAQVAAEAALDDTEYLAKAQKLVWDGLDYFYRELDSLGLSYVESQGNFLLFDLGRDSAEPTQYFLKNGLILRPLRGYGLPNHLRMSVGTAEENQYAVKILKQWQQDLGRG